MALTLFLINVVQIFLLSHVTSKAWIILFPAVVFMTFLMVVLWRVKIHAKELSQVWKTSSCRYHDLF